MTPSAATVRPGDERPHDLGDGISEAWRFDFASADGLLGGWVRFARHADRNWYEAMLAGPHRQLLAVVDHDVPHRSSPLEVRTTGLWADHICETPLEHWTIGLEAFALGVDDPMELRGRQLGDRVPLGLDLEWESDGPVIERVGLAGVGTEAYDVPCRVYGEVLIGDEVVDLAAVGHRRHEWGSIDWAQPTGWRLQATVEGGRHLLLADDEAVVSADDGTQQHVAARPRLRLDDDGLPVGGTLEVGDDRIEVDVLAPMPCDAPGAPPASRALVRLHLAGGAIGVGWLDHGGLAPSIPAG